MERAEAAVEDVEALVRTRPRISRFVQLVRAVVREQGSEQVGLAASGAAFWLVISAFPTATAAVSLFGLVVSPGKVASDLGTLARAAPSSLGSLITEQLHRVAAGDRAGLSIGLGLSAVLAVWSASAGVYNLDRAVRDAFGLPRQRYVEARGRALVGAFVVVVALGAAAIGASLVHPPAVIAALVGVPVALVGVAFAVAAMYRFSVGPTVRARHLVPGAVAAAAGVVVFLAAFAAYLAVSTRFAAVYGAFTGAAIGMVGTYLAVYAVLLGAVLNMQLTAGRER